MTEIEKLSIAADKGLEWKARATAAEAEIESDRTKLAGFITALDKALDGRFWLTEGRGSYSWDDDRYRDEFRDAAQELLSVIKPLRAMAANFAGSPKTTAEAVKARVDLRAAADALLSSILSVRQQNTDDWMTGIADDINAYAEATGELDRVQYNGDGLGIVKGKP